MAEEKMAENILTMIYTEPQTDMFTGKGINYYLNGKRIYSDDIQVITWYGDRTELYVDGDKRILVDRVDRQIGYNTDDLVDVMLISGYIASHIRVTVHWLAHVNLYVIA